MPTPPPAPRALALSLLLLPLLGCPSAPIPSEGQRAVISLDGAFDRSPWMSPPLPEAELSITATVKLPAARRAAAADLVLDGLWFHAKVIVDGEELPVVHGGAPTLRVPHARLAERDFFLQALSEAWPDAPNPWTALPWSATLRPRSLCPVVGVLPIVPG